ncbi:MAG: GNAT family N-acetyltransferase [Prevotella sp.]|nr:GNAT family N-acetyltransferase [Prevotella sp.]
MIEIVRYTPDKAEEWDAFVRQSKNATFLFYRNYMDYHADRFSDCSWMFYDKGRLQALLPANDDGAGTLWSHRGLTYGGLLMDNTCRAEKTCQLMTVLNDCLRQQRFSRVVYKHIPWIYDSQPSEEDLFAIVNVCHAQLRSRDIASVVMLDRRLPFSTLRKRGVKKGAQAGLSVIEQDDFSVFWQMLESHLWQKFQAKAVHSLAEITLLKQRFPEHIRLMTVCKDNTILGGSVLYDCGQTVKTQYIMASEEGRSYGALDFLFSQLLDRYEAEGRRFFDFGTSNRVDNDDLNESLIFQKEGFGSRAVCYDSYQWTL